MSRSSDDHDFSDRGLDIRPSRPEETGYLEDMTPGADERISTFCQRCRVWTLPGRPCPHEDGEA